MSKSMTLKPFLGLCCISFSLSILSTSAMADNSAKDVWLATLKEVAPPIMCKSFMSDADFNKQLAAVNINYDKCVTMIPPIYDKCAKKFYDQIPTTMNKAEGEKWGNNIGMCISGDFIMQVSTQKP